MGLITMSLTKWLNFKFLYLKVCIQNEFLNWILNNIQLACFIVCVSILPFKELPSHGSLGYKKNDY